MSKPFEKNLRKVRIRCSINLLIRYAGWILTGAGFITVLAVLIERLLALNIITSHTALGFWCFVTILIILFWLIKIPNRMQTSLILDERLRLHERFSTTLALFDSEDPFAEATRTETYEKAQNLNPQRSFPVCFTRNWTYAITTWIIALALVLLMPQKDLLGFLRKRNQQQQLAQQTRQVKADVNDITKAVTLAVKELGAPELTEAVSKLEQMPKDAKPEDIKRQAIRQMGDISDQIRNIQNSAQIESIRMIQRMFKQLRGSPDAFTQKIQLALAQGNFSQASAMINQLQQELAQSKLTEQQQQDLSSQLQNLAKELSELAQKDEELEKELEKLGLDKALAKLNENQLRQSLQQQGVSADKIEELLRKAAASNLARNRMAGLSSSVAGCCTGAGGLGLDELSGLMEQLDQLDTLQQQIMLTEASLAEIASAIACLGEGMCEGLGYQGPFSEGDTNRSGPGTGGPGIGWGPRSIDETGETSTKTTHVTNEPQEGPMIASWYFKESQIKGEAMREYSEVIQAGRDSAAEAITENEIPRKYEEAIKKYFGRLEQVPAKASGQSENQ